MSDKLIQCQDSKNALLLAFYIQLSSRLQSIKYACNEYFSLKDSPPLFCVTYYLSFHSFIIKTWFSPSCISLHRINIFPCFYLVCRNWYHTYSWNNRKLFWIWSLLSIVLSLKTTSKLIKWMLYLLDYRKFPSC